MPEPRKTSDVEILAPAQHLTAADIQNDTEHEPDACDVIAVDLTEDEHLPVAKGGVV